MNCPNCNQTVDPKFAFCPYCKHALNSAASSNASASNLPDLAPPAASSANNPPPVTAKPEPAVFIAEAASVVSADNSNESAPVFLMVLIAIAIVVATAFYFLAV